MMFLASLLSTMIEKESIPVGPELSARLAFVSFLSACMIVLMHSEGGAMPGTVSGWYSWYVGRYGITRIAVPFFFLMAGFFFSGSMDGERWYVNVVRKRFFSLIIPWVSFGVIFFLFNKFLGLFDLWLSTSPLCKAIHNVELNGVDSWLYALSIHPWKYCPLFHFWFVRCLFYFVLLSPALIFCKYRYRGLVLLAILFVVYGVGTVMVHGKWFTHVFSLKGLFYFSVGIYLRRYPIAVPRNRYCAFGLLAIAIFLWWIKAQVFVRHWPGLSFLDACIIPIGMLAVWWTVCCFAPVRWSGCRKYSFPVFVLHIFVLTLLPPLGRRLPHEWYTWVLMACMSIAISMGVTLLFRRLTPRFARLIFGGR